MTAGTDRKAGESRRDLVAPATRRTPFRSASRRLLVAAALAATSLPLCAEPDGRADWKFPSAKKAPASHALPAEPTHEASGPMHPSDAGSITAPAPSPPEPLAPVIDPLSSWIVSAGRTVSFRVAATLADSVRPPELRIDRLPDGASFEANADGTRTFYWPTDGEDQGEYRFRVTALHPDDDTLESGVDLLVVVGNSTLAGTTPLDEGRAASAPSNVPGPVDGSPALAPSATVPFGNDVRDLLESGPVLPQAGLGVDYWDDGSGGPDERSAAAFGSHGGGASSSIDADARHDDAPTGGGYFDEGGGVPLGPDGQPLGPDGPSF